MSDDDLIDRVHHLEHSVRFWRSVALGLGAALGVLLAIGLLTGVMFFSRAAAQRDQAEEAAVEAEMNQQRALRAMQEAEVQRQRAEQAAKKK